MARFSLTARWVLPVTAPPLERGLVTVDGETIVAVEPADTRSADVDFGEAIVLPGLVNAHTHLDLSGMRGLAPARLPLPNWLREVIAHRRTQSAEQVQADLHAGLTECLRTGTTLLGDISGNGTSWSVLAKAPIRAVVFRELLGLAGDRLHGAIATACQWSQSHESTLTCRPGLSPHAPYSAGRELYRRLTAWDWPYPVPLATHLGESLEELELLRDHSGSFVSFLQQLGVWSPEQLCDLDELLNQLAQAATRVPVLLAHGNYLSPQQVPTGATVVYCPRTHAAFGHAPYPLKEFLGHGIRVALGTDSLASNPDLDLLAEARFLRRRTELSGETILRLATLAGAEALGYGDVTGSLTPGKSADLLVVSRAESSSCLETPYDLLLLSDSPVTHVLCRGRWLVGHV